MSHHHFFMRRSAERRFRLAFFVPAGGKSS